MSNLWHDSKQNNKSENVYEHLGKVNHHRKISRKIFFQLNQSLLLIQEWDI